jgi:hypothetical protein
LVVESEFEGSMQHVLWQKTAGVISNMTSCADGLNGGERALLNLHSPSIIQYMSSVRVYNSGTTGNRAVLDVYNATSGEIVGTWTSDVLEAGAAVEIFASDLVADFENELDSTNAVTGVAGAPPSHLNVELQDGFNGHLQHTVRNTAADVLTDMSAKCALGSAG